jgi:hypothetical protein
MSRQTHGVPGSAGAVEALGLQLFPPSWAPIEPSDPRLGSKRVDRVVVEVVDEDREDGRHVVATVYQTFKHGGRVEEKHRLGTRSASKLWDTRPPGERCVGVPHGGPIADVRNAAVASALTNLADVLVKELEGKGP